MPGRFPMYAATNGVTYAAPLQATAAPAGSYVPYPGQVASVACPVGMAPMPTTAAVQAAQQEPAASYTTQGLPDPASVEAQKNEYSRSLSAQLERGQKSLQKQNAERKRQLYE